MTGRRWAKGANRPIEVNISVASFGVRANVPGYHPGVTVVEPLARDRNPDDIHDGGRGAAGSTRSRGT